MLVYVRYCSKQLHIHCSLYDKSFNANAISRFLLLVTGPAITGSFVIYYEGLVRYRFSRTADGACDFCWCNYLSVKELLVKLNGMADAIFSRLNQTAK